MSCGEVPNRLANFGGKSAKVCEFGNQDGMRLSILVGLVDRRQIIEQYTKRQVFAVEQRQLALMASLKRDEDL